MLAAILLAGGESRRMGRPKLTLELEGETLLTRAVYKAQEVADVTVVVVGAYAALYRREAEACGARVVENPDWLEGLGSSVRTGVTALPPDTEAALLVLPDQPFVPVTHLRALIKTHRDSSIPLILSRYDDGALGVPTLVHRSLFERARALRGSCGAKALLKFTDEVAEVGLTSSHAVDVDTPEEAAHWLGAGV